MSDPYDLTAFKGSRPKPAPSVGGIGRPKRTRPTKAAPDVIAAIRERKAQTCRPCGTRENVNAHHLIPRGTGGTIGGRWIDDNILGLCGSGVSGCHGDPAACYLLRARLTDAEYAYIVTVMGEGWIDRRYPTGVAA